jgi:hypothetical protein
MAVVADDDQRRPVSLLYRPATETVAQLWAFIEVSVPRFHRFRAVQGSTAQASDVGV